MHVPHPPPPTRRHCSSRHGYAGNSQTAVHHLYMKYPGQVQAAVPKLKQCLVELKIWMTDSKIKLNDRKDTVAGRGEKETA